MKLMNLIKENRLFKNMGYLTALQMTNYLFPLVTIPYLYRVIGIGGYGVLSLAQSVISYFVLLVNFGFYLSGPRLVAIHRENKEKISEIFSTILIIKSILMLVSFFTITLLAASIPIMRVNFMAYFFTMLSLVGEVLFPAWFFQGMESMSYITALNVVSKLIALVLLLITVRGPGDLNLACAIQALSSVLAGIMAVFPIFFKYGVKLRMPERGVLKSYMTENWNLFLAQFSTSIFNNANPVLLGFFVSNTAVGYYAAADKAVRLVVSLISPVTTAVYPRATRLFAKSTEQALAFVKRVLTYGVFFFLAVSAALFASAGLITFLMTGRNVPEITCIMRILSIIPTTIFINNIYGTQIMVNCGMEIKFRNIILFCAVFLLGSSIILIKFYSAVGAGIASLLAELLLAALMVLNIEGNKKLSLFKNGFKLT
ncbi:MAG TPA: flippase [Clostridia bacterium]|nr:flippase [Clostridia bacterium]